jgi:hypothetical protein
MDLVRQRLKLIKVKYEHECNVSIHSNSCYHCGFLISIVCIYVQVFFEAFIFEPCLVLILSVALTSRVSMN